MEKAKDRLEIIDRINEYEKRGWFDMDVEADPPTAPLAPETVDYTGRKLKTRINAFIANIVAKNFFEKKIKKNELIIKSCIGLENFESCDGGAILTCNHFNAFDNYAVYKAIEKSLGKRDLYKIIREGNYTSFKGLYGYFFRNCNTLPLCSSTRGLAILIKAVGELIRRGEKILIYPEQGMWWNYKKPRPLKDGAFRLAVRSNAPVIPFFITMEESSYTGADGFPILEYTVHISKPIYADASLPVSARIERMKDENYTVWKNIYEEFYKTPLVY